MAKKPIIKATQVLNHKEIIINSKQLEKEFNKKENYGKTYEIIFSEPEKSNINRFVGNYECQTVGQTVPPQPLPDKPPKVEAGDDVIVKSGAKDILLDGSASDDGTITSIEWIAPDGIVLRQVPNDETQAKFDAPELDQAETFRILIFTLKVEDDKGNKAEAKTTVTIQKDVNVPPVPPIPPIGKLIYDSNVTGRWRENRTFTDFDPLFPKPFVGKNGIILAASGDNPLVTIENGVLTLKSGKGHKRIYLDCPNFSTVTIYPLRFNDAKARNHTHQKQSRHNMGGSRPNKFGGFNHLVDLEEQKFGLKIELDHESGEHVEGGKSSMPKKLAVGQWLVCKHTDQIDLRNEKRIVHSISEYDYLDGNGFVLGHKKDYDLTDSKYDFIFNEELYRQISQEWFRHNPNETTQGFSIKDVTIEQLDVLKT